MSYTDDRIFLIDCMVKSGYTQSSATKWLNGFVDLANTRALEDSDHTAYRELADEVEKIIHSDSVPDNWDGDDSELYLLTIFLQWLPDMIRHAEAEKIRAWPGKSTEPYREHFAELIDPFRLASADPDSEWVRKSDGTPVPWNVTAVPE